MTLATTAPPTIEALVGASCARDTSEGVAITGSLAANPPATSPPATSFPAAILPTASLTVRDDHDDIPTGHEIRALNGLVIGILDNADEYRRAIFAVEQLLDSLQRGLYNRVQAAEHIQSHVRALGAQPATTLSSLAAALAARLKTRIVFAKHQHEELLRDAARGEDLLQAQFKQHFKRAAMSISSRACISRAFDQIMTGRIVATEGEVLAPFDAAMPLSILSPIGKLAAFSPAIQAEECSQASVDDQLRSVQGSCDGQPCVTAATMS